MTDHTLLTRRRVLTTALASSVLLPACAAVGTGTPEGGARVQADPPDLADAVTRGIDYFAGRCDDQIPLVRDLIDAIEARDIEAAKRAYVESRPPYEEIETLAASFEESDRDIDARPYSFEEGETSPDFRGFHKVEAFVFAYGDLDAALPFATTLLASVRRLRSELDQRARFSAQGQFEGMVTLANEVAAKKVSSEEETWSDQSLLIFKHNWIGIYSQYRPFAGAVERANAGVARRVAEAYERAMALLRPHETQTAALTPYSRIGIRERRSMADGSNRFRDAIASAGAAIGLAV